MDAGSWSLFSQNLLIRTKNFIHFEALINFPKWFTIATGRGVGRNMSRQFVLTSHKWTYLCIGIAIKYNVAESWLTCTRIVKFYYRVEEFESLFALCYFLLHLVNTRRELLSYQRDSLEVS